MAAAWCSLRAAIRARALLIGRDMSIAQHKGTTYAFNTYPIPWMFPTALEAGGKKPCVE
jgi:hypothetical protein